MLSNFPKDLKFTKKSIKNVLASQLALTISQLVVSLPPLIILSCKNFKWAPTIAQNYGSKQNDLIRLNEIHPSASQ